MLDARSAAVSWSHRRHALDHDRRQGFAVERAMPLFQTLGKNIVHIGDAGAVR
jgi:hypothetical protein